MIKTILKVVWIFFFFWGGGGRGGVDQPEKPLLIKGSFGFSDYLNDYNFNSKDLLVMNAVFTF